MKPEIKHKVQSLPKWARERLEEYEHRIRLKDEEMQELRKAHAVLFEYGGWFTIHGPPDECATPDGTYRLFFMSYNGAHAVCALGPDDIMLCGRKIKKAT